MPFVQDSTSGLPALPSDESSSPDSSRISRRHFSRLATAAAALPFFPGRVLTPAHPSPGESLATAGLSTEQLAEVEARLANVIRKYGGRLTEPEHEHIRRILAYNEKMLASIRSFLLKNGDSPASVLRVSLVENKTQKEAS